MLQSAHQPHHRPQHRKINQGSVALSNLRQKFLNEINANFYPQVLNATEPAADVAVGGTTRTDIVSREPWVKRGATFVSLARREMDPAGWAKFDKTVIDDWDCNMTMPQFRDMLDDGQFDRARLHAEIGEVIAGAKPGRKRGDDRILVHTTGLVSQDVAIAWWLYQRARAASLGVSLPAATAQAHIEPTD
ncbi:MAG: hypothetical protein EXR39_18840 [Betaproteobacteria bacterium]|nr:hypothetical protein [Betaproteobacteria bacterium]